ncbi:PTPA-CTERM sorting domain-containing protein [Oculatella sp. LEGE 06141]|uniref:PTPA-CTERM sorting domain-containing protein n=1 Tax=Oculatella sp. LEGE 06141 TaxID=1828648 RepID=UPI00187FC12F|nr:PTPA-CTERM sorting domain-containing protein [Oculatella sp. LEGE 06141]MBE9179505.1 PTPA-CTERM sorting domain-containing protein [Oculatella sp. LEGE 06141]
MNFKNIGLGLVATAAAVSSVALAQAPAHAFFIGGTADYEPLGSLPATLKLTDGAIINDAQFTATVANLEIKDLKLLSGSTAGGFYNASYERVSSYITGFKFNGVEAVFDLAAGNEVAFNGAPGVASGSVDYNLSGIIRRQDGTGALAQVVGSLNSAGENTRTANFSLTFGQVTEIPTPALLPGLVGMSIAALRKKRKDEELNAGVERAEARA